MVVAESRGTSSTRPERVFIGWNRPILASAVERLLSERKGGSWDLRSYIVVLPTSLAARRLSELLALKAQEEKLALYPPTIETVGQLPEQLYAAQRPFASELVQHLAWMQALQNVEPACLHHLVPVPPPKSATGQWLELGTTIAKLHRELASDGLTFQSVVERLPERHVELERWQALSEIQKRYLETLDALNLWDIQTARLVALEKSEPAQFAQRESKRIIALGCVDLNQTQRQFLLAVASQVEIWIGAPASESRQFDSVGCLVKDAWQDQVLPLNPDTLYVGNSPRDQAELTSAILADLGNQYDSSQITLGIPDPKLLPEMRHRLELCSVPTRHGAGEPLGHSEPVALLAAIGRYLESRTYPNFASLVRHPAMANLLRHHLRTLSDDWLAQIDAYYQESLPKQVDGFINREVIGADTYRQVTSVVDKWLVKLGRKAQPVANLVQPLLQVLHTAYDRIACNLDDPLEQSLYTAAKELASALVELRDVPGELQPVLTASELIDWVLRDAAKRRVPEAPNPVSVEILGWLELALDDAPALVVAGLHDGVVPESVNADPFLPNGLRKTLQMTDNEQRFARDVYAARVLLESRTDIRFVVGKTDASGDPLTPSRLLLACDLDLLPARVLHLVGEETTDVLPRVEERWREQADTRPSLIIPKPDAELRPPYITVTAFRDYLQCPYRYYLRHVLKLRAMDDSLAEMQASQFGVLIHDTLDKLHGPIGLSDNEEEVAEFLIEHLHLNAQSKFGNTPAAPVLIQIEQAELRLRAFAKHQAQRAAAGWQIKHTEVGSSAQDKVLVGKKDELSLVGRIDRIDYHPQTGRWAIWDYKTSESAKDPVKVHWSESEGWKDLQLPLYRHIARKLGIQGEPELGYIALPKQASQIGFFTADFSQSQLADADAKADEVVSRIAQGDFWPEKLGEPQFDDYARICQTHAKKIEAAPPQRPHHRFQESATPKLDASIIQEAEILGLQPEVSDPALPALLIRASAGTGKTFQLTNRLLKIILSGQSTETILATTFTRKAAGEILHRVMQRLASACLDESNRLELASHLTEVDTSAANCLAALKRVTRQIHRFRVSTLDSFFAHVARVFSFEMGLPNSWEPMDPVQLRSFQLQAIGNLLESEDKKTLVNLVRMLAKGESSRRVSDEILRTVNAGYETFRVTDEQAWDQLPLSSPPSEAALESALLFLESTRMGNKSIDGQLEKLHLAARSGDWDTTLGHKLITAAEQDEPKYWGKLLPHDLVLALQLIAERAAAELLPQRKHQTLASYQVLSKYDGHYQHLLRKYRMLAFADVTHYLAQWTSAGEGDPNSIAARLEFRLDCGIRHLLLDEFQDTAAEQWRILEPIARPLVGTSGAESEQSLFCVGDTKQAIYGWRGGVAEVFDSVTNALPNIVEQQLSQSFRSSPEVIDTVNRIFQNLDQHSNYAGCEASVSRWSSAFPTHETARKDLSGYVRLENGPETHGLSAEDIRDAYMRQAAQPIVEVTRKSSASIGVLLRTNAGVAQMISILRELGISASQDGGNPLTDSAAVELILSLVHLADHPGDKIVEFHVQTSPLAKLLPEGSSTGDEVALWFRTEVYRRGLGNTIRRCADQLASHVSWWDQHRLEQLLQLAYQFEASFEGRLRTFEQYIEEQHVSMPAEAQVQVMTIHRSKGLEFDAIFLPDLSCGLYESNSLLVTRAEDPCQPPDGVLRYMNADLQRFLPASWQRAFDQFKERQVIESLCLLYVAVTRARRALYMLSRASSKSSKEARQEFGAILQATLGEPELASQSQSLLYELGSADWFAALPRLKKEELPTEVSLRCQLQRPAAANNTRGLKVTAPSYSSHQGESVLISELFAYSQSRGSTYGTAMHFLFERVEWLENFNVKRSELRHTLQARLTPEQLQTVSLDQLLDDFEELLQLGSVRSVLSKSRYATPLFGAVPEKVVVDNERMVSQLVDGELVAGTMDRLVVLYQNGRPFAAEIFDYKTDQFDPKMTLLWLDERIEHHKPQLMAYARVVSKLFAIELNRIQCSLLMLSTDDLVPVNTVVPAPHLDFSGSPSVSPTQQH